MTLSELQNHIDRIELGVLLETHFILNGASSYTEQEKDLIPKEAASSKETLKSLGIEFD